MPPFCLRVRGLSLALALCAGVSAARADVDITLAGRMNLPNSVLLTNVVVYRDANTARLYAILGDDYDRVFIVDVTDPADMRLAAQINGIPGFDVRTWSHYLYTCDGDQNGLDSRIVDIADPAHPVVLPNGFPSAHTLQISSTGIMFAEFPGLRIFDLADPTAPALRYATGGEGHDSTPRGNRLYDFHGRDGTVIRDVSDPSSPVTLGVIKSPAIRFHHSGDVTADERYLYICDELSTHPNADVTIWDIADPANPARVGQIADPDASVHNLYVVGDLAYVAYYSAGFKVFDIRDPVHPLLAGRYDTSRRSGEGFTGAIGADAYAPDGNVYVCDIENGLFAFTVSPSAEKAGTETPFALGQNAPNPFNPSTTIAFELRKSAWARLDVFDVGGRRVRTLVNGDLPAGRHEVVWDGRDGAGRSAASGIYFYRLRAGDRTETRRMVQLK
ncbi:MAG TPA: FlgD immunoglobulin-like domain containing protein [Candidatus Krumholzibacteria bacterium]|nr:FlgD immunoglobulin-like domain containing protein [Candidatus Krumholzibacteria bacterium]